MIIWARESTTAKSFYLYHFVENWKLIKDLAISLNNFYKDLGLGHLCFFVLLVKRIFIREIYND